MSAGKAKLKKGHELLLRQPDSLSKRRNKQNKYLNASQSEFEGTIIDTLDRQWKDDGTVMVRQQNQNFREEFGSEL
jgi:hypothetical protein